MLIDGAMVDLEQENRRLQAELQAQTQELRGSRARLVAVGDAERRRLERDLHDGAQSRFAGVALHLRLAQRKAPPDSELATLLDEAIGELSSGIEELRELARGIHPAVLTQRGLEAALQSLASRAPLPVDVRVELAGRLPTAMSRAREPRSSCVWACSSACSRRFSCSRSTTAPSISMSAPRLDLSVCPL